MIKLLNNIDGEKILKVVERKINMCIGEKIWIRVYVLLKFYKLKITEWNF